MYCPNERLQNSSDKTIFKFLELDRPRTTMHFREYNPPKRQNQLHQVPEFIKYGTDSQDPTQPAFGVREWGSFFWSLVIFSHRKGLLQPGGSPVCI